MSECEWNATGGEGREGEGEAGVGGWEERKAIWKWTKLASNGAPDFKMVSEMKAWATRNTLGFLGFFRL